MKRICIFLVSCLGLMSYFTYADDKIISQTVDVLAQRTGEVPCKKFKGTVQKNCELTTKILSTSYSEYCSMHNCKTSKMEDMMAWLERKEAMIAKLTKKAESKPQKAR